MNLYRDARGLIEDMLTHPDSEFVPDIAVTWYLETDPENPSAIKGPFPYLHLEQGPASEGFLDRTDTLRLFCYAPGDEALGTLVAVVAFIEGADIETPSGFHVDNILVAEGRAPVDTFEYQSSTLNRATATVHVIQRPI